MASLRRGIFAEVDQDMVQKQIRMGNPQYLAAFRELNVSRSGFINLEELGRALLSIKATVESVSPRLRPSRPFHPATCCWLSAKFGGASRQLNTAQFCELMDYLQNARSIFEQVDVHKTGDVDCGELHRAFQLSGINMSVETVARIGRSYDADGSGKLEFDEFVQMRLEWAAYIDAWQVATQGCPRMPPATLLAVLEEIKRSLEPVGQLLSSHGSAPLRDARGLIYAGMFRHHSFQQATCERLIIRFGKGDLFLSFEQFCDMMVFLKEMKAVFCRLDKDSSGSLGLGELCAAFDLAGMHLPPELVRQIGQSYDKDGSGALEFDEFLQLAAEWQELWQAQARFGSAGVDRISALQLQELMSHLLVLHRVVNGEVATPRPFSLSTCQWLVARFGTCRPGESVPQGLTYVDFLNVSHYLKACSDRFFLSFAGGALLAPQLPLALVEFGVSLGAEAMRALCQSYCLTETSALNFDQFLHILLECQVYDHCFNTQAQYPTILTSVIAAKPPSGISAVRSGW